MKVAGETLQRSRRTSPAAGSYLQPWDYGVKKSLEKFKKNQFVFKIVIRNKK